MARHPEQRDDFTVTAVDYFDPKLKFECVRCDRYGMVSPKGVYRRFKVHMHNEDDAVDEDYCIVCASILTGRPQGEFMRQGRADAGAAKSQP